MAGSGETVIFEAFPRMALEEGSGAVERLKGKEFGREFFLVSEIKTTSGDPLEVEMEVAAMVRKLMMDKANHFGHGCKLWVSTSKGGIDEIQKEKTSKAPVETGKAAAVIDEIQSEKMDKAPVDGEKNQFSTMTREAPVETGKEAVAIDKYRLPADYVSSILAMPRDTIDIFEGDNFAKLMGVTEETPEEERQLYKEEAARMQRISNDFVLFQNNVREEFDRQGYVEVDEEYLTNVVKLQEYDDELCKDLDWSGIEFADPNDPAYASWYEDCEPEPAEVLCSV